MQPEGHRIVRYVLLCLDPVMRVRFIHIGTPFSLMSQTFIDINRLYKLFSTCYDLKCNNQISRFLGCRFSLFTSVQTFR